MTEQTKVDEPAEEKKSPQYKTWEEAPITFTEAVEVLERLSHREMSRQERLVQLGDRDSVHIPTMRDGWVLAWLGNWIRKRQIDQQKENSRYGRRY